jgi:hypothetical protein
MLWSFLGGAFIGGLSIFTTESSTSNELSMSIGWILIFTLILACLNAIFVLLLYLTARIIKKNLSDKVYILKYLLFEIIFIYILYYLVAFLSISGIRGTWFQIFAPFIILYIIWIIIIFTVRKNNTTSIDFKD